MSFQLLLQLLTLLATVTLAISGVLQAARSEMDFFGALVLACVCALGGGSLRDMLIGATPVFWATDLTYLATVLPTTFLTIVVVHFIPPGRGIRLRVLDIADALGLALFAILGAQKTLQLGLPEQVAVVMGAITGIAGGMIRDLLSQSVPIVLRGEVYASAAIIGTIAYTILRLFFSEVAAILCGMGLIVFIRLAALYWGLRLPSLKPYV
ncbi:MAG: hypothetical protein CSA50_02385 [Gammaproteobacteria bacterium]|nr:MAG: hypothetical protein CSA50_02385 [Gammaproteobacteria bacterium]